ncbi:class I SAM-dependent methyltransferase [Desulfovibrio sp. TomC]|uniref:class I SAM-dependent methyltransferase n=1 Tax=Desulfovibrio sp. TomC TaxID=1562888 RepID=UPI000574F67E|nr:class I SAM-dependent methyltransferase [Desulfovibrio sp. TomC]KHK01389.1 Methyltransferase type 11 [Desulfovibrio sp. TomC]
MHFDSIEYAGLRVLRRFFFTEKRLAAWGSRLPYYRVNQGVTDPTAIATAYAADLGRLGVDVAGKRVIEIGCGSANGAGYALAARGAASVVCHEPYALHDVGLDAKHLEAQVIRHPSVKFSVVRRVATLAGLPDASADIIVSNSVLEHVADTQALFADLARLLAPGGVMVHRVDYRDHFFKYPFQFLLYSKRTWNWFLNPGDLPRWRYDDHAGALAQAGFDVSVLDYERDEDGFAAIADRLHPDFQDRDPDMLNIIQATLVCLRRPGGALPLLDHPTGGTASPRTPPTGGDRA